MTRQLQDEKILSNPSTEENVFVDSAGSYIDLALDCSDETNTKKGITLVEKRKNFIVGRNNKCLLHYYLSVAYSDMHKKLVVYTDQDWEWEQDLVEQEIQNLRLAYKHIAPEIDSQIISNILVNLGNRYDNLGRFLLAFDIWNKASRYSSDLGMANINMGNSLMYYSLNYLNDKKYQVAYIQLAQKYFSLGLTKPLFPGVANQAAELLATIEQNYKAALNFSFNKEDLIIYYADKRYAEWCTSNCIWLNPISNINPNLECNKDDLVLLHSNTELNEFFDTICNDYIFCRKQFFNGIIASEINESEQLRKSAFRSAYSVFDKISYLINGVLNIEDMNNPRLSFSRIWYSKLAKTKGINPALLEKRNLMLRALY